MTIDERDALISEYERGYDVVIEALAGITDAEWDVSEAPGEWSPREIVHHLGDSEMDGAVRLRMILAEDEPRLTGWDQNRWAAELFTLERPVDSSLAAFKAAREATAPILRLMTEAQWERAGMHSEFGLFSAGMWLSFYGQHATDHADQIRRARAMK